MIVATAACVFAGAFLAKIFKTCVLFPACASIIGLDFCGGPARPLPVLALHLIILVTALQIGYLAATFSPLLFSMVEKRTNRLSAALAFSRAARPHSHWVRFPIRLATSHGGAARIAAPQGKDSNSPAA